MKKIPYLTFVFLIICCNASSYAQDKIVVIPPIYLLLMSESTGNGNEIPTVTSAGQVWMDRNLGSPKVAESVIDSDAYGWLYQWGRLSDGHQDRASATTADTSSVDVPGHGDFITVAASPYDWRDPKNDNLWQGVTGINNPCPTGFRLPTEAEWNTEIASWSSNNAAGAFASPLKLVIAGGRNRTTGIIPTAGITGYYWSSTVQSNNARGPYFGSATASMGSFTRAYGYSVRCIKD